MPWGDARFIAEAGGACQSEGPRSCGGGGRGLTLGIGTGLAGGRVIAIIEFLRRLLGIGPGDGPRRQCGAIPFRHGAEGIEFLLITTRRSGRWIFPKGDRMFLRSLSATAAQEAFEEAGVKGRIGRDPAGLYRGFKQRDPAGTAIEVKMYPLEVTATLQDWPEKDQRRRRWASLEEACNLLSEPDLVRMVRALAEQLRAAAETG